MIAALSCLKSRFALALLALPAALLLWTEAASANPVRFNIYLGSPPLVVAYPYPPVIYSPPPVVYSPPPVVQYYEPYPVYYYGYRHAGPPPWAHGYWKKHWKHRHGGWHHD